MQGLIHAKSFTSLLGLAFIAACSSSRNGLPRFSNGNPFVAAPIGSLSDWAKANEQKGFSLVFSGNVNGETHTCGCAVNPKGGLDRRYNALEQLKPKLSFDSLLLDAGNALFPSKQIDPALEAKQRLRASLILKAHRAMGISIQNVGILDLSGGVEFLKNEAKRHGMSLVSTNLSNEKGQLLFESSRKINLQNGLEVVVLGLSSPSSDFPNNVKALDPLVALQTELGKYSHKLPVIVLSDLGLALDRKLAEESERPLLIVGTRELSSLEVPIHLGHSVIVQAQIQGQQWGIFEVAANANSVGFYSPALAERFSKRWDELRQEEKRIEGLKDSEDKEFELDKLASMAADMARYAPGEIKERSVYDYRLIDISEAFNGKNTMSPLMNQAR